MMEIQEIEEILQQKQNPHRYRHTIGVRYTSICLAMRYGEDLIKASTRACCMIVLSICLVRSC